MFPYGITVTVERPTGTDRHGNPLPPTSSTVGDCVTAPAGSTEQTGPSSLVEWDLDLIAPHDADIRPSDAVVVDGERYAVFGRPQRFRNPFTGWEAGLVARLKGAEG